MHCLYLINRMQTLVKWPHLFLISPEQCRPVLTRHMNFNNQFIQNATEKYTFIQQIIKNICTECSTRCCICGKVLDWLNWSRVPSVHWKVLGFTVSVSDSPRRFDVECVVPFRHGHSLCAHTLRIYNQQPSDANASVCFRSDHTGGDSPDIRL